jgi:hypothetical protein
MVFIPRRVGGGLSGTGAGIGKSAGVGKKTIYGAGTDNNNGMSSFGKSRGKINAAMGSTAVGATQNASSFGRNTPWSNQPKKGWVDRGWSALVGNDKQTKIKQNNTKESGEMKIKFMDAKGKTKKDLMVKYSSRKGQQRMDVYLQEGENRKMAKTAFRRKVSNEISKEMKKLSRNSKNFKKQQGLNQIGVSQARIIADSVYKSRDLKTVLNKAAHGALGGKKSSARTKNIKIGK